MFTKDCNLETRKLLVNTFIRQVFLYQDKVVIVYNHTKNPDKIENTHELAEKVEGEIEAANKVDYSSVNGSSNIAVIPPKENAPLVGAFSFGVSSVHIEPLVFAVLCAATRRVDFPVIGRFT